MLCIVLVVRREFLLAGLIVAGALLGGCGGGQEAASTATQASTRQGRPSFAGKPSPTFPRELHVSLDGQLNPGDVAIYMAAQKGYFADVGLTVFFSAPVAPRRPVPYVAAYTDDLSVTQQPQAIIGKEHGAPIVAVGSLISQPTAAMIWLKRSGIEEIADLKGKTVAVPGIPYQEEMLESILRRAGVEPGEVEVKQVGYRLMPALLHGKADAIFGGTSNIEGAALRERGDEPVIKPVQELGVPAYDELLIITRPDRAAREPEVVRKFMAALTRGVAAVKRNPAMAVKLIEAGPHEFPTSRKETAAQVRATLPLLSTSGHFDHGQASKLATWMQAKGMIEGVPSVEELFTNRYLVPAEP